ncbi:thermonuclease family protein [Falsirhodobacter sp. 20TX0035]|uniref:thermonuclease family protein n=1 Tax=Falsirhodobacter sp. 20TX0035 TaxID=3022019 RepID=UPI0023306E5B|nr:thermonuclease family protein [Falsirhodobacter sp. 20TX0035]MDB6455118.1 thermonuclease family protein [Falsirhodobacter sp. 20TX0035]
MARMARRRKSYRRPGPQVWIAGVLLVVAIFSLGDNIPLARRIMLEVAEQVLIATPIGSLLGDRLMGGAGARVIDGDTLQMGKDRVRLHGIDAPESRQTCRRGRRIWACGQEATRALERLIGASQVTCQKRATDRYGRSVSECHAGGQNINVWMVRHGWAVAYRQYGGARYAADEAFAKRRKSGLWAGHFVMPWDWRKGKR